MSEADIVKAILKYLKTVPRCFAWKEHGGMYGTAGIPDIIACVNGRFYGFEVKTDKGKPTKLQEATIRKILAAGGTSLVVRSVAEVQGHARPIRQKLFRPLPLQKSAAAHERASLPGSSNRCRRGFGNRRCFSATSVKHISYRKPAAESPCRTHRKLPIQRQCYARL